MRRESITFKSLDFQVDVVALVFSEPILRRNFTRTFLFDLNAERTKEVEVMSIALKTMDPLAQSPGRASDQSAKKAVEIQA